MNANFFEKLQNVKPFFKAGFQGFAGDGKTWTAAELCRGLHKKIGSTKPVVIFDTETSAKFLIPIFEKEGIEVLVKRSRKLADLKETMKFCAEGGADVLLIDSITHVWETFLEDFKAQKTKNKSFLEFQDWGKIKPMWKREFSTPFVESPVHIMMTGRAGYEYEDEKNEETGKRDIHKSGFKMKAEGETAHEPDILIHMERKEDIMSEPKKIWREATIIKDRSALIDGKTFINPTFKHFEPVIDFILTDANYSPMPKQGDNGSIIGEGERRDEEYAQKVYMLENIEGILVKHHPSTGGEDKKAKAKLIEKAFHTFSWEQIKRMGLNELTRGYEVIRFTLEGEADPTVDQAVEKELDLVFNGK